MHPDQEKKALVIPESIVDEIQELHPDLIHEGSMKLEASILSLEIQSCTFDG